MPFGLRIQELSKQLPECHDEAEAFKSAQELHAVLHEQIEQMRAKVVGLPLVRRPAGQTDD
jgi:hypothetical protein